MPACTYHYQQQLVETACEPMSQKRDMGHPAWWCKEVCFGRFANPYLKDLIGGWPRSRHLAPGVGAPGLDAETWVLAAVRSRRETVQCDSISIVLRSPVR